MAACRSTPCAPTSNTAFAEARTTYGVIGVKCWIFKGDLGDKELKRGPLSERFQGEPAR